MQVSKPKSSRLNFIKDFLLPNSGIIILFFLVSFVPMFFVGFLTLDKSQTFFRESKLAEMEAISVLKADKIQIFYDTLISDMKTAQSYYNNYC